VTNPVTGDRATFHAHLERTLYVRQLDRPADGFRYEQVGSRPRVSNVR
jgi:hypothetical protein